MGGFRDADIVAGELYADLLRAFAYVKKNKPGAKGRVRYDMVMPCELAAPLVRALMRVEAELLLREADRVDASLRMRTPEERQADAFVALVNLLSDD